MTDSFQMYFLKLNVLLISISLTFLFLMVQFIISQHWLSKWLDTKLEKKQNITCSMMTDGTTGPQQVKHALICEHS